MPDSRDLLVAVCFWLGLMAFAGYVWNEHGRDLWHRVLTRLKTGSWETL